MQEIHGGIKEHSVDKVWSKYGMNGVQVFFVLEDKYSKVTCFHSMKDLIGLFLWSLEFIIRQRGVIKEI